LGGLDGGRVCSQVRRKIDLRGRLRDMAVGIREELGLVEGLTKCGILDA